MLDGSKAIRGGIPLVFRKYKNMLMRYYLMEQELCVYTVTFVCVELTDGRLDIRKLSKGK